ncbi:hypothetical protein Sta7437_3522 [Stanieria cyanosphaera PCC 7437]|uniref:Uncharacterized protein n=1 Tax=Stanieria cyanosphaera (strain ATCC 29371 / PCC 7437) TaxID=111780 RepID=K9XWP9_STAC7|nr:hypothetical protein [Stanieria cyanosphaera]AFZ37020.1 hypothetical protein Sta7437_3522 [Stanieria cyanosphaera PCC 7437]
MRPYKINKIDLNNDYPCPCRRRGRLKPITLTEAFGCDRCQQIFVVKENGQVIEQLSSIYHKRAWRWTGYRWTSVYSSWAQSSLSTALVVMMSLPILIIVLLPLILRLSSTQSIIFWAIVLSVLTIVSALMLWIAYRR